MDKIEWKAEDFMFIVGDSEKSLRLSIVTKIICLFCLILVRCFYHALHDGIGFWGAMNKVGNTKWRQIVTPYMFRGLVRVPYAISYRVLL